MVVGGVGEGVDGDGADQAGLDALGAEQLHRGLADAGGDAVGGEHHLGVLQPVLLHLHVLLPGGVQGGGVLVGLLHVAGQPVARLDPGAVGVVQLVAHTGPVLLGRLEGGHLLVALHLGQHHRLHHGADNAVGQDEHRVAVPVGVVKGGVGHVHRLLDGGGGEDHHLEAAVAAGLGGLEVVHLGGLDGADARAAPGDVGVHHGDAGGGAVGDALALQGDSGGGGGGHGPHAGGGGAVHHVHRGHLRLALDEHAAHLGHATGKILGNLILRGDGIAGKEPAARPHGRLGDGLAALHKYA